ncbi:hypothetical protein M9H77_18181 [Catharanthus roseus]|uniref:Uncharacterized protein n=1 Tax=Catharanthus roseus TaxID=4058 RepID=A0ACC0B6Q8_CATRO|nr:hypothetical protein M9H77_18181 [Catharanthus roseus]
MEDLNDVGPISVGVGVLLEAGTGVGAGAEGELMYMRANFERVVGSKGSVNGLFRFDDLDVLNGGGQRKKKLRMGKGVKATSLNEEWMELKRKSSNERLRLQIEDLEVVLKLSRLIQVIRSSQHQIRSSRPSNAREKDK